ncbi:MAG: endonuclease III domain-containing protein [Candidatus Altiarchaeota archaeon]
MKTTPGRNRLMRVYGMLREAYGPRHWWPADTPFEVCVGAILTQSASWTNVEKAIANLKEAGLLSPSGILKTENRKLARLIRPSLYYNVKARKLKEFARFLSGFGGRVEGMAEAPTEELRGELLAVWGIGPETADSILLYALGRPTFVVDAYTRRIFSRLGMVGEGSSYDGVKAFFEGNLPRDAALYNEYHALIVEHGKVACRTRERCDGCCLGRICAGG